MKKKLPPTNKHDIGSYINVEIFSNVKIVTLNNE